MTGGEAAPGDPAVGRALAVAEQVRRVLEAAPAAEADLAHRAIVDRLGGDHVVGEREHLALLAVEARRVRLGRPDHDLGAHGPVVGARTR